MNCRDRVAIVTGAAGKGMGRSIALTLVREGAKVAVNYRNSAAEATALCAHIKAGGGDALPVQADVNTAEGCAALVDAAMDRYGRVDICVVNPGAGWHMEPIEALEAEAALADLHAEAAPLYHLLPRVLPGMYERQWGRIVAIGLAPPHNSPAYAYNVAKAARAQACLLAKDAAWPHGVTVNIVAPGPVPPLETLEEAVEQCAQGSAWADRASATPQDIAEGVAFLCSEAGRFVTGCELPYAFNP